MPNNCSTFKQEGIYSKVGPFGKKIMINLLKCLTTE